MTGCTSLAEVIAHLRRRHAELKVLEYEAMREHRDLDAVLYFKIANICADTAAQLSTPAMEENN